MQTYWHEIARNLVEREIIKESDSERVFEISRQTGKEPRGVFLDLGIVSEENLRDELGRFFNTPIWERREEEVYPLIDFISVDFLIHNRILPFTLTDSLVEAALPMPVSGWQLEALRAAFGSRDIRCYLGLEKDISAALAETYLNEQSGGKEPESSYIEVAEDIEQLRDQASEIPVIRLVGDIFKKAIELRASDIHIEPSAERISLRFRVDGMLRDGDPIPTELFPAVVSRIKILSGLNIAERRLPQDGRNEIRVAGREVDLRVSIIPASLGEDVVIRLLDRSTAALSLNSLGLSADILPPFRRLIHRPHGLVLLTGPTGSGKTTTLFAAIQEIISPELKIITVEDPVEYHIAGICQIQVKNDIGFTFASALRSILRHDPNIILIGEIRDSETAAIAVQSALTGHLVLSSLHTNDAVSAFSRLIDMGVADYLATSAVSGVMAQRLIRRLCPYCRVRQDAEPEIMTLMGLPPGTPVYREKGCRKCVNGYSGRAIVAELLTVTEGLTNGVVNGDLAELRRIAAHESGFREIWRDAVDRVAAGETSAAEIFREVGTRIL